MYLDGYVTDLGTLRAHGSCSAGTGGREPADAAGDLEPAARQPRVSWRRCCRLPAREYRGTCGCCGRRGWSRSARRRSGGSTVFAPSRSPRSMNGWAGTGPCGSSGWMPCTPRWPGENANEGAPDDQQRTCGRPHPGQPAISRWQGHRAHGRPLRHRYRRPVVGTHRSRPSGPLDRRGRGRPAPRR